MASGSGYFKTTYRAEMALYDTTFRRFWLVVFLVALLVAPLFLNTAQLNLINLVAIATIGALALNLLTGYAGQISLGHAGFLAVGAFTAGILVNEWNWPFPATLAAAVVVSAVLGVVVGLPALRLRGLYLALGTLAFHFLVVYLIGEYQSRRTGSVGVIMPVPSLWGVALDSVAKWYYFLIPLAALVVVVCVNLTRTPTGRAWLSVRDRDVVAAAFGVNVRAYKLRAFVVSAALTGLGGAVWAYYLQFVSVEAFTLTLAIEYVAMIVIGGLGSILGSILGAAFVTLLPQVISAGFDYLPGSEALRLQLVVVQTAVFGLFMLLFLLFEPEGLVGIWVRIRQFFELWPLKYRPLMAPPKR